MQTAIRRAPTYARVYFSLLTLILVALAGLGQHSDRVRAGDKGMKPRVERKPTMVPLPLPLLEDPPANEIVTENLLTGSPSSEWDISGSGDPSIQGFATDISIDQGETIQFKIDATADYRIDIYRLGYYGGDGARKVATIGNDDTVEADQPDCSFDGTGEINLVDCGNWSVSASWSVPSDATSGIYIARPTRLDTNGASHIVFIVRDDDGDSDILFQTADTTWQAYNQYGGYSLYAGPGHARKVSYNRPFTVRGGPIEDWLFNAEYPMLRWLERNGYDVSYTSGIDSDRRGEEIVEHKVFMSVGHDEYWSAGQRTKVEAARDAGVHLAFFSGNEIYWKTRWEAATVPNGGAQYRTLVSYKEGSAQGSEHYNCSGNFDCDPHPTEWTGLWRQNQTGHDGGRPENSLSGQISWGDASAAIQVPASAAGLRFWRNTGMSGATTLENNTLGYEFDWEQPEYASSYPAGRITLSDTTAVGKNHKMSLYRASSGALVFGAGTVQWSWGLDGVHDRGASTEDPRMQQATVNILSDMGAQPGTLQAGLVEGEPLDVTLPSISITSPADGADVPGGTVEVTGTAADNATVASVEVSTDNGTTWQKATGTVSWSYSFAAPAGPATVLARSIDDAANIGPHTQASFEVGVQECPCTIFSNTITGVEENDPNAVELGVKFRSDIDGYITGIRFYKTANNTGVHTGRLWSTSDTSSPLAAVTFADETASGWQEALFSTPVPIVANTTYIASYHTSSGMYSIGVPLGSAGVDNPPLRALQNGVDGPNGVYTYGPGGIYPTESFNASNYLVDVKFDEAGLPSDPTPTPTPTPAPTPTPIPADQGPGGPILVISDVSNPFSRWYGEILQAQGLNSYLVKDISTVDASTLTSYDVVILGEIPVSPEQATMLAAWVNSGGNLIAMRPDSDLSVLLGITDTGLDLSNGYLLVDTNAAPGTGIVGETVQFHGTADLYSLNGATSIATLYSDATTSTVNPAVTLQQVGSNGGQAVAFTYDLARSIVYTRQGNPAWAGQERDLQSGPIRANDMFYPDWIDLNKVSIPQADEQQHLLTNLIRHIESDRKPLPQFWFLPKGLKAAVVMTGDDHGNGGTSGQFDGFKAASPSGCSVDDWECIRSTSYVYPNTTVNNAASYQADGFEIGLHVNTGCANWSLSSLTANYTDQLADFSSAFPGISTPVTNRTHCIAWSDWASQPKVELSKGIRLDTNYYYWPAAWINDRPGMFTGSGMPMRFADLDGTTIDVYQAATQLTDESGQDLPLHIDTLLDNAIGVKGYYGVFTTNMHTDQSDHAGANAIVASAQSRGVPVVSAKQMLTWLDGRNSSSFENISWSGNTLAFNVEAAAGSRNLTSMVPIQTSAGTLTSLTLDGDPQTYETRLVKGSLYALFASPTGTYTATYTSDTTAPTVISTTPATGATDVPINVQPTATFSEAMDPATVNAGTVDLRNAADAVIPATISLNAAGTVATIAPTANLAYGATYTATIKSGPTGVKDVAGNELATGDYSWIFTTPAAPPAPVCPCSIWDDSATPNIAAVSDGTPIEVGVKFRSSVNGYIMGIRFYKGVDNTGVHVGHLWQQSDGAQLGEATFTSETASGWQTVSFSSPIPITANTTYVASYFSPNGYFAYDANYFASSGVTNGPLTALQAGIDGPNGVFNYGSSSFPSTAGTSANYWVDVIFDDEISDTTEPTITDKAPASGETSVLTTADVTATFSENMNAATINGTTFKLTMDGYATPLDAVVSYSGLTATLDPAFPLLPNTLHHVTVMGGPGGVTDAAGNPMASGVTWSFTTGPNGFTDTTLADFSEGSPDAGISYTLAGDGEVILKPLIGDDFFGSALGSPWVASPWPSGGSATVNAGQLLVNGALVGSETVYTPGRSLEFAATFASETYQHVGFGIDLNNEPFWAMFSTNNVTGQLYARTNNGGSVTNTPIAGAFISSAHRYRIEWLTNEVKFYVDGSLVVTHSVTITTPMRPVVSDFNPNASGISVDWIRMSEFASSGIFVSRIFDAGTAVDWTGLSHTALLPTGTALGFETRTAVTPGVWSAWSPVTGNSIASPGGRYLQYRLSASGNGLASPEVQQVTVSFAVTRASAAEVTVSGRVLTAQGRGVSGAMVVAVDGEGNSVVARTNTFGHYILRGLGASNFYVLSASARHYEFAAVTVSPEADLAGIDFIATGN